MRRLPALRGLLAIVGLVLGLAYCPDAQAYPWMIKHGFFKCGACHTDPSGGETLTHMGRAEAEYLLSWNPASNEEPRGYSQYLFGAVPEPLNLRLGGSYRHMLVYTAADGGAPSQTAQFPMQLDGYGSGSYHTLVFGGSIGVARGITGSAHVRGAQLNRELGEGWIVLSRSHFVGVQLDRQTLLRFGRLNLPFGLRIPEHVAWVREATRTDRESDQQHGLALSYAEGRVRAEGMIIAGNFQIYPDLYRERGYSVSGEYLATETVAFGVSSLVTRANEDRFTQREHAVRQAHAIHARAGLSPEWAFLAEVDVLREGGRGLGGAGLMQLDYEPLRGLHLMYTGEYLDRGAASEGASISAPLLGSWFSADFHFLSHFELRLDLVDRQLSPLSVEAQLHVFL